MPSKIALTPAQWRQRLLAVLPPWILEDVEESVLSAHLAGAAAVLSQCEQDAYDQIDETWIERCSEETLRAHMAERLVPELGYIGDGLRRQVQRMWDRVTEEELLVAVRDLAGETAELAPTVTGVGHTILDLPYNDSGDQIINMATQERLFNVIIDGSEAVLFHYASRDAYADSAFAGFTEIDATLAVANRVRNAVDFYKASGVRFRVSKRT